VKARQEASVNVETAESVYSAHMTYSTLNPHATPFHVHEVNLDVDFTVAEVVSALEKVKGGKAADIEGRIVELFKKATILNAQGKVVYCLAEALTVVLNEVFRGGTFPSHESLGMIIPIFKGKGDTGDCNNYRGITIITIISKLYATVINTRLVQWSEAHESARAETQAGFRKGRRTCDHMMLLQHLIDSYKVKKSPLFTCFIDLSKAFDTVDRSLLWSRLISLGVTGRMLSALKAYYADVKESVKTSSGATEAFDSKIGVKQGCPLSPTLFGIFIDALEGHIRATFPHSTIRVGKLVVPQLLYADDIVLVAESQGEMQKLLDALSCFCSKKHLTVNLAKSAVVVFENSREGDCAHSSL